MNFALQSLQPKVSSGSGSTPVCSIKSEITKIRKFAVYKHNEDTGDHVEFVSVTKAEIEIVDSGANCHLTISGRGGPDNASQDYSALVFEANDGKLELKKFSSTD